jgi:hypothetical protein
MVTLIHWGGGTKVCKEVELEGDTRLRVYFGGGAWLTFLLATGNEVGHKKSSALDDGKSRLSKWRLSQADLKHWRMEAFKAKVARAKAERDAKAKRVAAG